MDPVVRGSRPSEELERPAARGAQENLLVISDVHLGSDLVDAVARRNPSSLSTLARLARDLTAFLEHYASKRLDDRPWRLVVAGDLIDFIGMAILPAPGEVLTQSTDEERLHGLGSAEDHAVAKLRRVVERHRLVFTRLADFVSAGNRLVLVRGNHDADLHWSAVQAELRAGLCAFRSDPTEPAEHFDARIEVSDWFHWVEGVAFVEHGHQYDAYCSFDHVMKPLSPRDPRRTAHALSDVLLRYIVRPTAGMREDGHESMTALDYLRFGLSLGVRGCALLALRFVRAIFALLALTRDHASLAARRVRDEHERHMETLSELTHIGIERIRSLAALHVRPVTHSAYRVLSTMMVDRVLWTLLHGLLAITLVLLFPNLFVVAAVALALVSWGVGLRVMRRYRVLDPTDVLLHRAAKVAALFPAAYVVMGHTHLPRREMLEGGATYVNVGTWASEGDHAAPCTHLVIRQEAGGPVAELLRWDATGPVRYTASAGTTPVVEHDGGTTATPRIA